MLYPIGFVTVVLEDASSHVYPTDVVTSVPGLIWYACVDAFFVKWTTKNVVQMSLSAILSTKRSTRKSPEWAAWAGIMAEWDVSKCPRNAN